MSVSSFSAHSTQSPCERCFACNRDAVLLARCLNCQGSRPGRYALCHQCAFRGCPFCHSAIADSQLETLTDDADKTDRSVVSSTHDESSKPCSVPLIQTQVSQQSDATPTAFRGLLAPSPYQQQIYEESCSQNIIASRASNTDRMLICVMACDYYLHRHPTLKTVICVNDEASAKQLAGFLEEHSLIKSVRVTEITHSGAANRSENWWSETLLDSDIIVATGHMAKLALLHRRCLRLDQISLLVLDGCHWALCCHPYASLLCDLVDFKTSSRSPRILGLTTSCLEDGSPFCQAQKTQLEKMLKGKVCSPPQYFMQPRVVLVPVDGECHGEVKLHCRTELHNLLEDLSSTTGSPLRDFRRDLSKCESRAAAVFDQCGLHGWLSYVEDLCNAMAEQIRHHHSTGGNSALSAFQSRCKALKDTSGTQLAQEPEKLQQLLKLLSTPQKSTDTLTSYIIFVGHGYTTRPMACAINDHFCTTVALHISGVAYMDRATQLNHLNCYREGRARIIIAPASMFEVFDGDVASGCSIVDYDKLVQSECSSRMSCRTFRFEVLTACD
eukprot:TRINITY_DN61953_c0_g1_i1.p1 TRINITY_DN61953_c0_g1~~TRINITY_DN61953_c0_g1_i1.p1  ORF type:complete len:556 (+),score=63.80 TRINITY_DN61953_c0_g1_i1:27-1694(+)